ncbi:fucose mutarotase isoform X1 [Boleophthalmus pectinirostris]|uniref:fucose mutarotase isoform X1 n=1 Tax=Boleophthalmus pectinirostris TaxID=150288 RepID=UPI00242DCE3C|nr:fucose mutarotase isoform X1 [Boleophthalmus pectinirostris]
MVVLKGIPHILSPELLYVLAKMGHGDELVLADVNFPTSSICVHGPKEIRADGLGIPQLLEAILKLMPLDTYVPSPAAVMVLVDSDKKKELPVPVWNTYSHILHLNGAEVKQDKKHVVEVLKRNLLFCRVILSKLSALPFMKEQKKPLLLWQQGKQLCMEILY